MRALLRLLVALVASAALASAAAYLYLRQSLPQLQGELALAGLSAPVEVLRDAYGIPHIFAASIEDAQFALGFVHAQDRLWQMEMSRRTAAGRLAEILGASALDTDRFLRTLGIRRAAEASLRHYDADTTRQLDAYAAGVNAFLATRPVLPPEFWILRVSPQSWTAADSVAWTRMMAWDLGGNWRSELLRMRLARMMPTARVQEFLPPYPGEPAPALPNLSELYSKPGSDPVSPSSRKSGSDPDFSGGSNSWVVSGARSASGKPLLANDPHLGLSAPSLWYFAHLHAPGLDAIGATLPGVPGIILGRNQRIAWGYANAGPDVQDLYLEKRDAVVGSREETIKVRGAADQRVTIRFSRHGPLISEASDRVREAAPKGQAIALAWTAAAEDDLSLQAALKLARAHDWSQFVAALKDFHSPQQVVTYADVDGNIGWLAPGRIPLRKYANDLMGLAPAPGWDRRYDWAGMLPFEVLPRGFNPAGGSIVAANQKIVPRDYPHHLTSEWQPPYRAQRIEELLAAVPAHTVPSFARMQLDNVSLAVRELLPRFISISGRSAQAREALQRLAQWDGTMAAERAEPLIFVAWWREFARALYADELGEAFYAAWSTRAVFVANVLANRDGQARWCDDARTPRTETCAEMLSESLEIALSDLRRRYGADPRNWSWGAAHRARHRHRPLTRNEWLRAVFDFSVPSAGDGYTLNVGRSDFSDPAEPFASRHAASLRAIYDLADPQASLFIHSGGQSGNPLSEHYKSFTAAWARGDYVPMVSERSRLEAAGVRRLVLTPRK